MYTKIRYYFISISKSSLKLLFYFYFSLNYVQKVVISCAVLWSSFLFNFNLNLLFESSYQYMIYLSIQTLKQTFVLNRPQQQSLSLNKPQSRPRPTSLPLWMLVKCYFPYLDLTPGNFMTNLLICLFLSLWFLLS